MASLKTSIIMVCLNFADLNVGSLGIVTQLLIPSKNFAILRKNRALWIL